MKEVHSELVDVVLLTQENGSTMLCRGGEEAVKRAWGTWPIVKAEFTGEKQLMQWIEDVPQYDPHVKPIIAMNRI